MDVADIPSGYGEVDFTIRDGTHDIPCKLIAGHVAFKASSSVKGGNLPPKLDTISPSPQWFLYTV